MKTNLHLFLHLALWLILFGTLSCTTASADRFRSAPKDAGVQAIATVDQTATAAAEIIVAALAITPSPTSPVHATPAAARAATQTVEAQTIATAVAATVSAQSPTPDQIATQTAQAYAVETVVAATLTAQPIPTIAVLPTSTSACQAAAIFVPAWQLYQNQLGCPTTTVQQGTITVEPFAGGYLVWIKATDRLLYTLRHRGGWSAHADMWESSMPDFACDEARHYGFPAMGFGLLWCLDAEVKSSLGAPSDRESPDDLAQMQLFEGGRMFHTRMGITFILFTDHTWVAL